MQLRQMISPAVDLSSSKPQLKPDRSADRVHMPRFQSAELSHQPPLAGGGDLVGHGLAPFSIERDVRFRWIEPLNLA